MCKNSVHFRATGCSGGFKSELREMGVFDQFCISLVSELHPSLASHPPILNKDCSDDFGDWPTLVRASDRHDTTRPTHRRLDLSSRSIASLPTPPGRADTLGILVSECWLAIPAGQRPARPSQRARWRPEALLSRIRWGSTTTTTRVGGQAVCSRGHGEQSRSLSRLRIGTYRSAWRPTSRRCPSTIPRLSTRRTISSISTRTTAYSSES